VAPRRRPRVCGFVLDDSGVAQVRAVFRAAGTKSYYWTKADFDGLRYCAWLPQPSTETATVDYYLEAFDDAYDLSRSREYAIRVDAGCTASAETPPTEPATVAASGPDQPAGPPGFDPATFRSR
jgi:hypothetical protein